MTLRTRVTLASGVAVLIAVAAVSAAVFVVVRGNLRDQIDDSLRDHAAQQHELPTDVTDLSHVPLVENVYLQVVDGDGLIVSVLDDRPLPVTGEVRRVAGGEREEALFDAEVDGTTVRVLASSPGPGVAFEIGRSLEEVDESLRQLAAALVTISIAAVALAALIGRLVAAAAAAPVHRVADAAAAVAQTGDLDHHLHVPTGDDLGRLAESFNAMLDALAESLANQRRLVADASHELRTPLATIRTNVEVLARAGGLPQDERSELIADTVAQVGELTRLVDDLVELARGDEEGEPLTAVSLDDLVLTAVETVERSHPTLTFRLNSLPSEVLGAPTRLTRAVTNLLDNAGKWSPPGGTVEVNVDDGTVTVRDHGPGVTPEDRPRIFDRFYRSAAARTLPGSGLGLAIVKQVADSHAGTVTVDDAPGGGAVFVLRLPAHKPAGAEVPTKISSSSQDRLTSRS